MGNVIDEEVKALAARDGIEAEAGLAKGVVATHELVREGLHKRIARWLFKPSLCLCARRRQKMTRFLIAGLGSIGRRHLRNLLALGEHDILLYRTHQATLSDDELLGFPAIQTWKRLWHKSRMV